jgi:large subunit ribosomal protein L29
MKAKELREQETGHLNQALMDQIKHLFTLRAQAVTEKLEDPSQLGKAKREIARIKTILRQRELAAATEGAKTQATVEAK